MQRPTPVFIVTSSRPRVGKTLVARALTEYFTAQNRPVAAFDVNPDEPTLTEHLPAWTTAASLDDTRGEVALFDQLVQPDQVPKVVDLGHQSFERFFAVMQQIDFTGEARRRAIAPMVLFVADPDKRAHQGYAMLLARFPDLAVVPVLNEHVQRVGAYRTNFPAMRLGGDPISVPKLSPVVGSVVDRRNFSFVTFVVNSGDTTSELYEWMRDVFISFRELEVRLLLGGIAPQLKQPA
jgi:hypothetical protein